MVLTKTLAANTSSSRFPPFCNGGSIRKRFIILLVSVLISYVHSNQEPVVLAFIPKSIRDLQAKFGPPRPTVKKTAAKNNMDHSGVSLDLEGLDAVENLSSTDQQKVEGRSNLSSCKSLESIESLPNLHRRRTLYLIRHGEAEHNVLEKIAQAKAKEEAMELRLSPEETHERMEEARKSVLQDKTLRDAPLTDKGRGQARATSEKLKKLIANRIVHHPTEAICSPLSRCLETCKILLEDSDLKAHIRPEIAERRTLYPPDKPKPLDQLLRCTKEDDRFSIEHMEQLSSEKIMGEALVRESKEMLRERANEFFDLLMECKHRHVLVVSHKGFLRELERGLLQMPESPLFDNCELRVYRVIFTVGDRELFNIERMA